MLNHLANLMDTYKAIFSLPVHIPLLNIHPYFWISGAWPWGEIAGIKQGPPSYLWTALTGLISLHDDVQLNASRKSPVIFILQNNCMTSKDTAGVESTRKESLTRMEGSHGCPSSGWPIVVRDETFAFPSKHPLHSPYPPQIHLTLLAQFTSFGSLPFAGSGFELGRGTWM